MQMFAGRWLKSRAGGKRTRRLQEGVWQVGLKDVVCQHQLLGAPLDVNITPRGIKLAAAGLKHVDQCKTFGLRLTV